MIEETNHNLAYQAKLAEKNFKEYNTNGGKNRKTHLWRAKEILRKGIISLRVHSLNRRVDLEIIRARAKNNFNSSLREIKIY